MRHLISFAIFMLWSLLFPTASWSALGGDAASVQADQTQMKAILHPSISMASYHVNTLQTPAGTTVREYVSTSGTVFAVVWQGPVIPDLKQVLGQYFVQYSATAKAMHRRSSHLRIRQSDLVVHSSGHMRAFFGKAYVPSLLPAGVTPDDIK
jgi:hypothetical protein